MWAWRRWGGCLVGVEGGRGRGRAEWMVGVVGGVGGVG